jgi:nitric oxide synthase oxygenase domain/subunit
MLTQTQVDNLNNDNGMATLYINSVALAAHEEGLRVTFGDHLRNGTEEGQVIPRVSVFLPWWLVKDFHTALAAGLGTMEDGDPFGLPTDEDQEEMFDEAMAREDRADKRRPN